MSRANLLDTPRNGASCSLVATTQMPSQSKRSSVTVTTAWCSGQFRCACTSVHNRQHFAGLTFTNTSDLPPLSEPMNRIPQ